MFVAKQEFRSPLVGLKNKGDEVIPPSDSAKKLWLESGLIEEKPSKSEIETKPEPKKKRQTKHG